MNDITTTELRSARSTMVVSRKSVEEDPGGWMDEARPQVMEEFAKMGIYRSTHDVSYNLRGEGAVMINGDVVDLQVRGLVALEAIATPRAGIAAEDSFA